MEGKGTALLWVVLSVLVCLFGTLVMQLRESVADTHRTIKRVDDRCTNDLRDVRSNMQQEYHNRLEKLQNEYRNELNTIKKLADTSGKLSEKVEHSMESLRQELQGTAQRQQSELTRLEDKVSSARQPSGVQTPTAYNCQDILKQGHTKDGVYKIADPTGIDQDGVSIYCDMTFNHGSGGWMVMQRRSDPTVTFDRNWRDYHDGFGDPAGDFWLGNKYVRAMTAQVLHELRIDMWESNGENRHATYTNFSLGPAENNYTISFESYSGTAMDSFRSHANVAFSTYDSDNDLFADGNCADIWKSGWWFTDCLRASLNGQPGQPSWNGIKWEGWHWKDDPKIVKAEMKIRPMVI